MADPPHLDAPLAERRREHLVQPAGRHCLEVGPRSGEPSNAPRAGPVLYQRSLIMTHRDRAGGPAAGESVRASESLDDVPQDPRLPSYPPRWPARWPDGSPARSLWVIISEIWYYILRDLPPREHRRREMVAVGWTRKSGPCRRSIRLAPGTGPLSVDV